MNNDIQKSGNIMHLETPKQKMSEDEAKHLLENITSEDLLTLLYAPDSINAVVALYSEAGIQMLAQREGVFIWVPLMLKLTHEVRLLQRDNELLKARIEELEGAE